MVTGKRLAKEFRTLAAMLAPVAEQGEKEPGEVLYWTPAYVALVKQMARVQGLLGDVKLTNET